MMGNKIKYNKGYKITALIFFLIRAFGIYLYLFVIANSAIWITHHHE